MRDHTIVAILVVAFCGAIMGECAVTHMVDVAHGCR